MNEINFIFDWLLKVLERPLLTNAVMISVAGFVLVLIGNWQNKKAQIEINAAAERIKFEIQKKYLLTEIQTRNLLEIYPKLYDRGQACNDRGQACNSVIGVRPAILQFFFL